MAWIQLHQELPDHPKLLHLAQLLGLDDPDVARAKLENIWLWAVTYCHDGRLTVGNAPITPPQLARAARWNGDVTLLQRSLIDSGWIDVAPGGPNGKSLQIHDWQQYAGKYIEIRARNADRMRKTRAANVQSTLRARAGQEETTAAEKRGEETTAAEKNGNPLPGDPSSTTPGPSSAIRHPTLERPNYRIGLRLLAAAAPDLGEEIKANAAVELPIREITAIRLEAQAQRNPAGWVRRAIEKRWKRDAEIPPEVQDELLTEIERGNGAPLEIPRVCRPPRPRLDGESEDDYLRRVEAAKKEEAKT